MSKADQVDRPDERAIATSVGSDANGSIVLPATAALAALPDRFPSRHGELGLRHPLGAYNTSVAVIRKRVVEVIRRLETVVTGAFRTASEESDALLDSQEALLHGLMQHMDDCLNILRGFTADRRAFAKSGSVKGYRRAIEQYRSHVGKVVGRVKHQQGRLTLLTVRCAEIRIAGYFVAVGLPEGSVGPDPDIHRQGLTAFSFNRDLRFHLCHVLLMSSHLAQAIERLTGIRAADLATGDGQLTDVVLDVTDLPDAYFPDEYWKAVPRLRFERRRDAPRRLVVDFVSFTGWPALAGETFEARLQMYGDGSTRKWKLPYSAPIAIS